MPEFISYVKSTIDKAGVDIAEAFGGGTRFVVSLPLNPVASA